jgi:hypothetical protein
VSSTSSASNVKESFAKNNKLRRVLRHRGEKIKFDVTDSARHFEKYTLYSDVEFATLRDCNLQSTAWGQPVPCKLVGTAATGGCLFVFCTARQRPVCPCNSGVCVSILVFLTLERRALLEFCFVQRAQPGQWPVGLNNQ